jgi:hypothetical protein
VLPSSLQPWTDPLRARCTACHRGQLGDDRGPFVREPRGRFKLTPQSCKLPVEAVEHRLPRRSHNSQRFPLADLLAPPLPRDRLIPSASHGRCTGLRGPMPCARRQRSDRRRAFSRRSAAVMGPLRLFGTNRRKRGLPLLSTKDTFTAFIRHFAGGLCTWQTTRKKTERHETSRSHLKASALSIISDGLLARSLS